MNPIGPSPSAAPSRTRCGTAAGRVLAGSCASGQAGAGAPRPAFRPRRRRPPPATSWPPTRRPAAPARRVSPRPAPKGDIYRDALAQAYKEWKGVTEGKNADYIPVLAKVDPVLYGIVLVTVEGPIYEVGDSQAGVLDPVGVQAVHLRAGGRGRGREAVQKRIGVNATGQTFNSILAIELNQSQKRPPPGNPFVNAGAIATVDLLPAANADPEVGRHPGHVQRLRRAHADGERRGLPAPRARPTPTTGPSSQLLKDYEVIKGDPAEALDLYTRQCSVNVNARDLAMMGATLANGGRNPITKQQMVSAGDRQPGAGGDGHRWTVRDHRRLAGDHRACRPRAAWAAGSSPSCPGASPSAPSRPAWTRPATASAARRRSRPSSSGWAAACSPRGRDQGSAARRHQRRPARRAPPRRHAGRQLTCARSDRRCCAGLPRVACSPAARRAAQQAPAAGVRRGPADRRPRGTTVAMDRRAAAADRGAAGADGGGRRPRRPGRSPATLGLHRWARASSSGRATTTTSCASACRRAYKVEPIYQDGDFRDRRAFFVLRPIFAGQLLQGLDPVLDQPGAGQQPALTCWTRTSRSTRSRSSASASGSSTP